MKKFPTLCLAFIYSGSMLFAQTAEKTIKVIVEKPWNTAKTDEPVVIDIHSLNTGFTVKSAVVKEGNNEIPSQLDDLNFDLRADELAFVTNLPAQSKKVFTLTLSSAKTNKTYPARVFAEMLFRTAKSNEYAHGTAVYAPGDSYTYTILQHHGIAFESELVAYRIYFNEKQTTDLYGKFNKGLEIEESMFYPTDEQLQKGFGDDVILVRGSC